MAKKMSTSHMKMGSGKMSSQHGLSKNTSPTKGMVHPEGRVGAGTRPFKNNLTSTPGGKK